MRAVFAEIPEYVLDQRRAVGADRWDEMWEGVLHMPPMPGPEYQDLASGIEAWLRRFWLPTASLRIYREVNVSSPGGWPRNYRIPDLVLLDQPRFGIVRKSHLDGPPLVVVEIHSPGDETYEKLQFYAELGVPETWVIHRDTRKVELLALGSEVWQPVEPDPDGWLVSPATGIWMRNRRPRKLVMQQGDDVRSREALPHELP